MFEHDLDADGPTWIGDRLAELEAPEPDIEAIIGARSRRRTPTALVAVAAAALVGWIGVGLAADDRGEDVSGERPTEAAVTPTATTTPIADTTTTTMPAAVAHEPIIFTWGRNGPGDRTLFEVALPDGVLRGAATVHRREARLTEAPELSLPDGEGWFVPIDVIAVDPDELRTLGGGYVELADRLAEGSGVMTNEALTQRGVSGHETEPLRLTIDGVAIEVPLGRGTGPPERLLGGAELAVARGSALDDGRADYHLFSVDGEVETAREMLAGATDPTLTRVKVATPSTPARDSDATAPMAVLKRELGEFAVSDTSGDLMVDPAWAERWLWSGEHPVLGRVTCHRVVLDAFDRVVERLTELDRLDLIDPGGFAGCFNPRPVRGGGYLSKHAWGAALDLNWPSNPLGSQGDQDPLLIELMEAEGFTWGGRWLRPDPTHFEWGHAATE